MTVLFVTHSVYGDHLTGHGHPERPERLDAVLSGAEEIGLDSELVRVTPRPASTAEIGRVHSEEYVTALERFCRAGGGRLDGDTNAVPASWDAALLAAGAGLTSVERLRADQDGASAAFCAVRPPGHHAVATHAMGFCLFNNIAVTAAALAAGGERVMIVDIDAHHGNGTQDAFYTDPNVAYVSFHQHPLYPGTGSVLDTGRDEGRGWTVNLPLPAGATGDVYRDGMARMVAPLVDEHRPDWLLISAGFDGHRDDPLTDLGLSAGDYADMTRDLMAMVPAGRRVVFLEGGYDLNGLRSSSTAMLTSLAGDTLHVEAPTSNGPGSDMVSVAVAAHQRSLYG